MENKMENKIENKIENIPEGTILKLEYLQGDQYFLLTDSQDIQALIDYLGKKIFEQNDIDTELLSGLLVVVGDGDYDEVWATESNAPWKLAAHYTKII